MSRFAFGFLLGFALLIAYGHVIFSTQVSVAVGMVADPSHDRAVGLQPEKHDHYQLGYRIARQIPRTRAYAHTRGSGARFSPERDSQDSVAQNAKSCYNQNMRIAPTGKRRGRPPQMHKAVHVTLRLEGLLWARILARAAIAHERPRVWVRALLARTLVKMDRGEVTGP